MGGTVELQPVAKHRSCTQAHPMDMTIRKLAKMAGTSYSTVSRALNDSPLVKSETKSRIQSLARHLGYQVNFSAKSLATGMRMIVGVVYPYHTLRPYQSAYTAQVIDQIRRALDQFGFDTLVAGYGDSRRPEEDITRLIRNKKVDGLVVFGHEISESRIALLEELGYPFILVNPAPDQTTESCHQIRIDQQYGGYLAGKRLIEAGRRNLLVFTEGTREFKARTEGFLRAISEAGASTQVSSDQIILENGLYETAYDTVEKKIDWIRRFDGIFVQSDLSSIGVLNCLLDYALEVPREISIVGFDDIQWARYTRPRLTTVHQPVEKVVERVSNGIVDLIRGNRDERIFLELQPVLADRDSC